MCLCNSNSLTLKAFPLEDQRRLVQFYIQVFFSNAFAALDNNPEHTNFLFFAIDYLSNSDTDVLLDNFEIIDNPGRGPSSYDPSPRNSRRSAPSALSVLPRKTSPA
jgi:hypothetical protein